VLAEIAALSANNAAKLDAYRVVYFATHGLVAGDVKGLGEPSLALTLPAKPNSLDDGLLTASEVSGLKLNADWVVLSACNTAARQTAGAEALSGLARAFFYVGARALLVSHWSVASDAATRLTTSTFAAMAADPKAGRAEAPRQAMLAYMNDASNPNARPAFWGPFSVIGQGASVEGAGGVERRAVATPSLVPGDHRASRRRRRSVGRGAASRHSGLGYAGQPNKLSRTYATLLEALNRHRGKGALFRERQPDAP
jgi:CHAT domain